MHKFLGALGAVLVFGTPSLALPIRHDVDPESYLADPADYPALFGLYETDAGYNDCVGTLIATEWAITAAHCTEDPDFVSAVATDAGYSVNIQARDVGIVEVIRYDEEAGPPNLPVDFALLRLSTPVDWVDPIRMYRDNDEVGRIVILAGWGDTGDGRQGITTSDGIFRSAENRVDAADDGWLIWRFDDPRSSADGALPLEGISGPGDSGGPAFLTTPQGVFLAGVSSSQRTFGQPEGTYGVDEYYVRVSWYADWIDQVIAND